MTSKGMADHVQLAQSVPEGGPWHWGREVAVCAGGLGSGSCSGPASGSGTSWPLTSEPFSSPLYNLSSPSSTPLAYPALYSSCQLNYINVRKPPPLVESRGWVNMKQNWSHNAAHKGQTLYSLTLWTNFTKRCDWFYLLLSANPKTNALIYLRSQFPKVCWFLKTLFLKR